MRQVPVFFMRYIYEEDIYSRSHTGKFFMGNGIYDFCNDIGGLWFDIVICSYDVMYDGVRLVLVKISKIFGKIFGVLAPCRELMNSGKIKELWDGNISRKAFFDRMYDVFGSIWDIVGVIWRVIFGKRSKKRVLPREESSLNGYWRMIDPIDGKDKGVVKINDIREGL